MSNIKTAPNPVMGHDSKNHTPTLDLAPKKKDSLSQASLHRPSFFSIYTARRLFKLAESGLIQVILI